MMIKSYPNGITLRLDNDTSFSTLLEEAAKQFRTNRKFFGKSTLALRLEGRPLTPEQEDAIAAVICRETDLKISCILSTEGEQDKLFVRALRQEGELAGDPRPDLRLFSVRQGSLAPGESLHEERSLLLAGNVPETAEVICDGSVILLGTLEGRLICGGPFAYVRRLSSKKITVAGMALREKSAGLLGLLRSEEDCLLVAEGDSLDKVSAAEFEAWFSEQERDLFGTRPAEEELF